MSNMYLKKSFRAEIKVVIDLPISNCHKSHEWFQKSRLSITPYKYYFVWKLGDKSVTPPKPPTQALSVKTKNLLYITDI